MAFVSPFRCKTCGRGSYYCECGPAEIWVDVEEEIPPTLPSSPRPRPSETVGIKYDGQKPKLSKYLHPLFANRHFMPIVLEVIEVLKYGATKYGPDNWTLVEPKERYLDAALRHLSAVDNGEWLDDKPDPEGNPGSGLPHVAHAACSVLMFGAKAIAERLK